MSIRLICSDIDGTLLQYGKKELESEIFEQIRELHRRGILFCPASGRQYTSLRKLFAPVADCCVFLCENGGVISFACCFSSLYLAIPVRYSAVQYPFDLIIRYPDTFCFDLCVDALVQLLFRAMHRQLSPFLHKMIVLALRRLHNPRFLFRLQVTPFLIGLK